MMVLVWSTGARAQIAPCEAPANQIVAENCRPGSPAAEWDVSGAGDPTIQGFATDISVNRGETVEFKVSTAATAWRIDVYRLGWYGGLGARRVAELPGLAGPRNQIGCLGDDTTGLVDCGNWEVSASWAVPADATSGVYLAKLTRTDVASGGSHVVFVVRDDDGGSDVLFQTADTTWQAYNRYGGNSLYTGSPAGRAYEVSYNRPFTTRAYAPEDWVFNAEYPAIRWLERNGYDVSYFTGVDADRRGGELLEHAVFLSVGHDEYWSGDQRAHVEAARDAGVNLAFWSGNEVFWKTRWRASIDPSNTPHRTLVSYKETHADASIDPTDVWTGTFRDPRAFNPEGANPENALTGTIFTVNCCTYAIEVPEPQGKLRFWRDTEVAALPAGGTATLPDGTLGYEWDEDLDNGARPGGLVRLSTTTVNVPQRILDFGSSYGPGVATHHLALHRRGNALVFGAGTVQWSWGLDDAHDRGGPIADARIRQATVNLLADMGVQPATLEADLVPATASTDTVPPTAAITSPAAGATVGLGATVLVAGTAEDVGGLVGAVEVSTDGGLTWHPADGTETWTYRWVPGAAGSATLLARATDDSIHTGAASLPVTVTVGAATGPVSVFDPTDGPAIALANDGQAGGIEVGVRFFADVDGLVTALRFYKGAGSTGTYVGHLWTDGGTLLASATFPDGTASGWQEVALPSPVPITAGTVYVASRHSSSGDYAFTQNFFATTVSRPPLHLPASGLLGPNGVYRYGPSGFPTSSFNASNYWVDLVFAPDGGPDTRPPAVVATAPGDGAVGIPLGADVTATFSEPLDPASLTAATFSLRDGAGAAVTASLAYDAGNRRATLDPAADLAPTTTYTATVGAVRDLAGNALSPAVSWSFTTAAPPPPPPDEGPGGPILVLANATNPFTRYYAEILRAEGLNLFDVQDIAAVGPDTLAGYRVAILGEMPLTEGQAAMLGDWTAAGGALVAMRPSPLLAPLLGLAPVGATVAEGYLRIDTATAPGAGLAAEALQFHGEADRYAVLDGRTLASLHGTADGAVLGPAVTLRPVGAGRAAAFTFDLARSVVLTRQGNPAWAGQERDGVSPIRSDDLFYGADDQDPQPDWVDLTRVAIPQADEQQRLLANLLGDLVRDTLPLPRYWYFPRGAKAVVLLTGDEHGSAGVAGRLDQYLAASPPGCSVDDWECIRGTVYLYTSATFTDAQAAVYQAQGFEVALHPNTGCADFTPASLENVFTTQLAGFAAKYPSAAPPRTNRNHCIVWSDWLTVARTELRHGMRLDTNYYYWPPSWVQDRPGFFTGSGMPMRFADVDGTMVDVYQAATQMTDESGQSYPFTITTLLDRALGPQGYYGVFTANMHMDSIGSAGADAIVAQALARGVPVVSSVQLLAWLDGRNGSAFEGVSFAAGRLQFDVSVGAGAGGLTGLLPVQGGGGALASLTRDGLPVPFVTETVKGVPSAFFEALPGRYVATYGEGPGPVPGPAVVDDLVADFAAGTTDAATAVVETEDGEVILAPAAGAEFSGDGLPVDWSTFAWQTSGSTVVVGGGRLSVDGARASTAATFVPGRSLEFVATFGGPAFQNVGLGVTLETGGATDPWVMFGTNGTPDVLQARVNLGNAVTDVSLGSTFIGTPHRYRIDWNATGVVFSVDGTVVHATAASPAVPLRPVVSDFALGGAPLTVDWLRLSDYPATGTFRSRILDAGAPIDWGAADYLATLPAGASVSLSVRTGDTPLPDASWTPFTALGASGAAVGATSRYLQYQAVLATTDARNTPALEEVRFGGIPRTNLAPSCTGSSLHTIAGLAVDGAVSCVDPDADPLRYELAAPAVGGEVLVGGDGGFRFEPAPGFAGMASFELRAADPSGAAALAPVTIEVDPFGRIDTTVDDFDGGLHQATRSVALGDGALVLAPDVEATFDDAALPAGFATQPWSSAASPTFADGAARIDGWMLATDTYFTPGRSFEAVATFGAAANQHLGLGEGLNGGQEAWAIFSTRNTTNTLSVRTFLAGAAVDRELPGGAGLLGSPHRYRIDWTPTAVLFHVDDALVATIEVAIPRPMRPLASDLVADGTVLAVDSLRLVPSAGTFVSRVHDAGASVPWGRLHASVAVPPGAEVAFRVRTGETPTPDATWTDHGPVALHGRIPATARYVQYEATLTGAGPASPVVTLVAPGHDAPPPPENRAPVCPGSSGTTAEDTPLAGAVVCTDEDGDALTYALVSGATNGTVDLAADGSFVYTPGPDFFGSDSFSFRASDGELSATDGAFAIEVTPVNDPPLAGDDAYETGMGVALEVPAPGVLANDLDPEGGGLSARLAIAPEHGSVILLTDGSFLYTPDPDHVGLDSFAYDILDDGLPPASARATVSLTVLAPVNERPAASPDAYVVDEDLRLAVAAPGVLANDLDLDGDPLAAVLVSGPEHGSLALAADGSFTYEPDEDFHGTDGFTYLASDGVDGSAATAVTITVLPVNDAPDLKTQRYFLRPALAPAPLVVNAPGVLDRAEDVEGDGFTAVLVTLPRRGQLTSFGEDGSFTYVPGPDFSTGTDSFTFAATDDHGATSAPRRVNLVMQPR